MDATSREVGITLPVVHDSSTDPISRELHDRYQGPDESQQDHDPEPEDEGIALLPQVQLTVVDAVVECDRAGECVPEAVCTPGTVQETSFPVTQSIQPRIAQYERNGLLQTRPKDRVGGLTELERFLAEKEHELGEPPFASPAPAPTGKLEPRKSQYQPNHVLETEGMLCELELLLEEKRAQQRAAADAEDIGSATSTRGVMLMPRTLQYEENTLLETKDDQGRTAIEQFLVEHQMSNNAGPDSSSTSFTGANNSASRRRSRGSRSEVGEQVASSSGEGKHVRFKQRSSGSIDALHSVRTKLSTETSQPRPSRFSRLRHSVRFIRNTKLSRQQNSSTSTSTPASSTSDHHKTCTIS